MRPVECDQEKTPWRIAPEPVEFPPRMKSNLLRTFFEWALITSVLMSVLFFAWFLVKSREARAYNVRIARAQVRLQSNRNLMAVLQAECQAYARTNADFAKFLATPAAAPAQAPAAPTKGGK
jgi:hypothetical protein